MARNKVRLQKRLNEAVYGTEEKCRAEMIASRWPNGFECSVRGGRVCSAVGTGSCFDAPPVAARSSQSQVGSSPWRDSDHCLYDRA